MRNRVPAATGLRLTLRRGDTLRITDVLGHQVADLVAFDAHDSRDGLSAGRTFDYNGTIRLSTGHVLYSKRSKAMLRVTKDTAGRHDFLHAPCSQEMFSIQYGVTGAHPNCLDNLSGCLVADGIRPEQIDSAFNVFMHVDVDPVTGAIAVQAPSSGAGDHIEFQAERDLVVAVAACAAENTNAGRLKPIDVEVLTQKPGPPR